MKRAWVFIGIILLVGGILFEEKHRAETIKNHLPPVVLGDPAAAPYVVWDNNFSDYVDLWGDPKVKTSHADSGYASFVFENDPKTASFEKFQSKLDYEAAPVITMQDREVAYALFQAGSFTLKLNLKPAYPNPEAILPTRIDASLGGSFSF
jgi:hypothetical protein